MGFVLKMQVLLLVLGTNGILRSTFVMVEASTETTPLEESTTKYQTTEKITEADEALSTPTILIVPSDGSTPPEENTTMSPVNKTTSIPAQFTSRSATADSIGTTANDVKINSHEGLSVADVVGIAVALSLASILLVGVAYWGFKFYRSTTPPAAGAARFDNPTDAENTGMSRIRS